MKSNTGAYKKIIIPIISKHLPQAKVILYGSRARAEDKPGSDIDIALDEGKKVESTKISAIVSELEESLLPIKFDIVDLHAVSQEMQHEILKDGVIWKM